MDEICEDIKADADRIVESWDSITSGEPWLSLPKEYRIDHLPRVIAGLAEIALCSPYDADAHRENLAAAANHGTDRRRQGFPEHLIFREYHLLREAIWDYLQRYRQKRRIRAITRIDSAISLASTASLKGYYREELEEKGEWQAWMDELLSRSPFLEEPG